MGGGKPTKKTEQQKQLLIQKQNENLNKLYKSIESHPLYSERLFKEFAKSSKYKIPRDIKLRVANKTMKKSEAIVLLEYWLKILLIMDDKRLRRILVEHWEIVNKDNKNIDEEIKSRGLEGEFDNIVKMKF